MRLSQNKKQLIIASQSDTLYTTKRLLTEGLKLKCEALYINPYQFSMVLNPLKVTGKILETKTLYFHRTTGVNYDDFDLAVSHHFESTGARLTNPLSPLSIFRSKDRQALFLKNNQIPFIPTVLFRGDLSLSILKEITSLSPKSQKYVLKMSRGNGGVGVNYVESLKSLVSLLETFKAIRDQKMLIQAFVPHQKEWRIFVIKNEIMACIEKKISPDDFRGNSKRSLGKLLIKPPQALIELAQRAYRHSQLDYAGIDIILDSQTSQYVVCEINAVPGFEQIENLSQINIARELITHI